MHRFLVAALGLLAFTASADAADRTVVVGTGAASATWAGAPADSVQGALPCAPPDGLCDARVETTLIRVTDPGTIVVTTAADGPSSLDVDLALYASDAAGTQGELIADSAGTDAAERTSTGVAEPGHYLAVVSYYTTVQAAYTGAVSFHPESVTFLADAPADRKVLSAEDPTFAWTGGPGNGLVLDCGATALNPCDYALVKLAKDGALDIAVTTGPVNFIDYMNVYRSNAAGGAMGDPVGEGAFGVGVLDTGDPTKGSPMNLHADLEAGYYLIEFGWLASVQDSYSATARFTEAVPEVVE